MMTEDDRLVRAVEWPEKIGFRISALYVAPTQKEPPELVRLESGVLYRDRRAKPLSP